MIRRLVPEDKFSLKEPKVLSPSASSYHTSTIIQFVGASDERHAKTPKTVKIGLV